MFLTCVDFSTAVADLKNEHELDKQHLQSLHRQEVEALKTVHSHTRWEQAISSTQLLGMMSVVYTTWKEFVSLTCVQSY